MTRITPSLIVVAVIAALLNVGIPRVNAAPQKPSLKSESQIKGEANLYDTAIREISRIETMKLTTADDVKPVKAILERHIPNLKFNRSKLVTLGLNEPGFVNAAKARTSDNKKAEEFARELAANDQAVYSLSGAQSVKDKINRSFAADVAVLRRVADYLKRSSDQIKAKAPAHHATHVDLLPANAWEPNGPPDEPIKTALTAVVVTSLVISAVMIVGPLLVILLPAIASAAVGAVYTAALIGGAAVLVVNVVKNIGTEQGRDKVAECMEKTEQIYADCVTNSLLRITGACLAQWVLDAAFCLSVG